MKKNDRLFWGLSGALMMYLCWQHQITAYFPRRSGPFVSRILSSVLVLGALGSCLASGVGFAFGRTVTVADVIAGIQARRSAIVDIRVRYSIELERTDWYYQVGKEALQQAISLGVSEESSSEGYGEPKRKSVEMYFLQSKGNKLAYQRYDVSSSEPDGSPSPSVKAVFDGNVQRALSPKENRGSIRAVARESAVSFLQVEELFNLEAGQDFVRYLEDTATAVEVVGTRVENDDVFVDLRASRKLSAGRLATHLDYALSINASKDFWPVEIRESLTVEDPREGTSVTLQLAETRITGFHRSGGIHFPASVLTITYLTSVEFDRGNPMPKLGRMDIGSKRQATIHSVEINTGIPDTEFELEFPPGTRYLDNRDGQNYLVDEAGTIKNLAEVMGWETKHRPSPGRAPTRWRTLAVSANLVLFSFLVAYGLCRWWLQRRKLA